jgi:hypothetical protein
MAISSFFSPLYRDLPFKRQQKPFVLTNIIQNKQREKFLFTIYHEKQRY